MIAEKILFWIFLNFLKKIELYAIQSEFPYLLKTRLHLLIFYGDTKGEL